MNPAEDDHLRTPAEAAIRRVSGLEDDHLLTPREVEVVRLIACGMTNREIAAAFVVSPLTIKTHVANVMRKLGAQRRSAVVAHAVRLGIVPDPIAEELRAATRHAHRPGRSHRPDA